MSKTGVLHLQLVKALAELRHKDTIIIGDTGFSIPKGVECVDLGWRPGDPVYLDVLEETLRYIMVEEATFVDEVLTMIPNSHKKALSLLSQGLPVEHTPRTELKERSKDVKAIVLTGKSIRYTNVILSAGCTY